MPIKKNVSETDTENSVAENECITENSGTEAVGNVPTQSTAKVRYNGITNFVYVGPSLPSGRLKSLTTLNGTFAQITEYYKESIELFPNVERLIIPVAQLADSREKTQKSGNLMYNYYQEIATAIKAKGVEQ